MKISTSSALGAWRLAPVAALVLALPLLGQAPVPVLPGYDEYQKISKTIAESVQMPAPTVTWKEGGKLVVYSVDGQTYQYDIAAGQTSAVARVPEVKTKKKQARGKAAEPKVARGRVPVSASAPDGQHKAFHRDRNLWLSTTAGGAEIQISTDGDEKKRIRYGTASWVYGEELAQRAAIWWSPDSQKVAFYRFDESKVADYYLTRDQAALQSSLDVEPYPKAGAGNPVVDLFIHDLATHETMQVDVRDGQPFDNSVVGHYVYDVRWSVDSKEILFYRTNRQQNVMELAAGDVQTGAAVSLSGRNGPQAGSRTRLYASFSRITAALSGHRNAPASRITISTIWTADCWRRSPAMILKWPRSCAWMKRPGCSITWRAVATTR